MAFKEEEFIALIKSLTDSSFYGRLDVSFENGKIVNCKKSESINADTKIITFTLKT